MKEDKMITLSRELIDFVVKKYNIKNYDDFSCDIMKRMAIELEFFK